QGEAQELILDLNDHTIDRSLGTSAGSVLYVPQGNSVLVQSTGPFGWGNITGGENVSGGGIHNEGNLTITGVTISGNTSSGNVYTPPLGGGIYNKGTLTLQNVYIENNTAGQGGGIYNDEGSVCSIIGGKIHNNATTDVDYHIIGGGTGNNSASLDSYANYGGGIACNKCASMEVARCEISGNKAKRGGGVYLNYTNAASCKIEGCTIKQNTATERGGGLHVTAGGVALTNNTKVQRNSAEQGGGIMLGDDENTSLDIDSANITSNTSTDASSYGAGIRCESAALSMAGKVIIKDNKCGDKTSNLHLGDNRTIACGTLTKGSKIGLHDTADSLVTSVVTTGYGANNEVDPEEYFFSENGTKSAAFTTLGEGDGEHKEVRLVVPMPYVGADGSAQVCKDYTPAELLVASASATNAETEFPRGFVLVLGNVSSKKITNVSKDTSILLCDGATYTTPGLHLKSGSLAIYGQEGQTGTLRSELDGYSGPKYAGIGGSDSQDHIPAITINGGTIIARGGPESAGIGGGLDCNTLGDLTINGGKVVAFGGACAPGIGRGVAASAGTICRVVINGGEVEAHGGDYNEDNKNAEYAITGGAGIGGGGVVESLPFAHGLVLEVNGGKVVAQGGSKGYLDTTAGPPALGDYIASGNQSKLTLGYRLKVSRGDNEGNAQLLSANDRGSAMRNGSYVRIEPCTEHHYENGGHVCAWCGYEAKQVKITYTSGSATPVEGELVWTGEKTTLAACPFETPAGKVFCGWTINGKAYAAGTSYVPEDNVSAAAIWKRACTISFNANGGEGTMGSVVVAQGDSYALPDASAFTPPLGSEFASWQVNGRSCAVGDKIVVESNITVTPQWHMTWSLLRDAINNAPNNATITLTEDVTATSTDAALEIPANKTLTLNLCGHALDRNMAQASEQGNAITVAGTLTIRDSAGDGMICGGMYGTDGSMPQERGAGCIYVKSGAHLTLESGEISGNSASFYGIVHVDGGSFDMTGGLIDNNSCTADGFTTSGNMDNAVVYVGHYGSFAMTGGSIEGNLGKWSTGVLTNTLDGLCTAEFSIAGEANVSSNERSDVYLGKGGTVTVADTLTGTSVMRVELDHHNQPSDTEPVVITSGLAGKGDAARFVSTDSYQIVSTNNDGEAVIAQAYNVSFEANGGTGIMGSSRLPSGSTYTLPTCDFTAPEHMAFSAWSVKAGDADAVELAAGKTITITGDTVVTALWKETSHALTHVAAVEPTCQREGCKEHYVCSICGKVFTDAAGTQETTLDALRLGTVPHKPGQPVQERPRQATCDEMGSYDEVVYCVWCHWELSRKHVTTPASGHSYGQWRTLYSPSTTSHGLMCRVCENNEAHMEYKSIPAIGHVHEIEHVDEVPAGCTKSGVAAHWRCTDCGLLFSDANGQFEVDSGALRIPAKGHTPGEATISGESEPTCEDAGGYNEIVKCATCGQVLSVTHVETPALGHLWGEPTYEWSADRKTVTATRTCTRDASHVETETAQTVRAGNTYTASFTNPAFETQTKAIEEVEEDEEDEPSPSPATALQMWRLYNPNSGEHFYTASAGERDLVIAAGWRNEGKTWRAPLSSSTPVYRLYNRNGGDHHYTMSAGERDLLVAAGWSNEGIGWYSDDAEGVAVLRAYNPNAKTGSHHFTTSAGEIGLLVAAGWSNEGIGWYGVA
ncbi:MAG: InlB B-repeat-containing protein, partial [Coriobacteriales bacterium]|nr:InlB B-repeat-containing protein [Coriobacteriales bacterium]